MAGTSRLSSRACGGEVRVFHVPAVIHGVKGGVPDQEPKLPGVGSPAVGRQRPSSVTLAVALGVQSLVAQHRVLRRAHPELLRPVPLGGQRVMDDRVPVTPATAGTLLHLL